MKIKNERILKNGAIGAYVYYSSEKKWKWRIIGHSKKKGGTDILNEKLNKKNENLLKRYNNALSKKIRKYSIFSSKTTKERKNTYREQLKKVKCILSKKGTKKGTKKNLFNISKKVSNTVSKSQRKTSKEIKDLLKLQENVYYKFMENMKNPKKNKKINNYIIPILLNTKNATIILNENYIKQILPNIPQISRTNKWKLKWSSTIDGYNLKNMINKVKNLSPFIFIFETNENKMAIYGDVSLNNKGNGYTRLFDLTKNKVYKPLNISRYSWSYGQRENSYIINFTKGLMISHIDSGNITYSFSKNNNFNKNNNGDEIINIFEFWEICF